MQVEVGILTLKSRNSFISTNVLFDKKIATYGNVWSLGVHKFLEKNKAEGGRYKKNKQVNTIKAGKEERHYHQNNVMKKTGTQIFHLIGLTVKGTIS